MALSVGSQGRSRPGLGRPGQAHTVSGRTGTEGSPLPTQSTTGRWRWRPGFEMWLLAFRMHATGLDPGASGSVSSQLHNCILGNSDPSWSTVW